MNITIKEKIESDFKKAYLERDMFKKDCLNTVRSEVQRSEAGLKTLGDAEMIKLLKKMIDSITEVGGETATKEIEILSVYMPQMLSEDKLEELIQDILEIGNFADNVNIGQIMGSVIKQLTPKYGGLFDAKTVQSIIVKLRK